MEPKKGSADSSSLQAGQGSPNAEHRMNVPDVGDNEYWNYCDNCGTRLETFRCRYVCPKCGFFHSCSEP